MPSLLRLSPEYAFFDQTIANFYTQESQLSQLFKIFSAMAIFISCLGLYGLMLIAWITVGYTAIRAARANPVKSLRTE